MREKRNFAERTKALNSDEARKKYFLVYEGKDTELLYFDAVNELKNEIGINPLIELIPIVRSYSEEGWSNPKKIVDRMIQNINESQSGAISYETMLNFIMDYFENEGYVKNNSMFSKSVWKTLVWICEQKLGAKLGEVVSEPEVILSQIFRYLSEEADLDNLVIDIEKIINYSSLTYAEGFDKICFVVDRDKESFTEQQYDYVVERCQEKEFGLYITNPCFEFWLLLHFADAIELDKERLRENPSVSAKRRYAEDELRRRIPGYRKSKYDALSLVRKIDTALLNQKYFCQDISGLKTKVGSNIGVLINEMRL